MGATIASLNVVLSATSDALTGPIQKSRNAVHGLAKDVAQAKAQTQGGIAAGIKSFASGGDQGAAVRSIGKLLKGGGAVMGFRLLAADAEQFKVKLAEINKTMKAGDASGFDVASGIASSIPILGQAWQAGTKIGESFLDAKAMIAEAAGASKEWVFHLKSGATALAEANAEAKAMVDLQNEIAVQKSANTTIGLKGAPLIQAEYKRDKDIDAQKVKQKKTEVYDPSGPFANLAEGTKKSMVGDYAKGLKTATEGKHKAALEANNRENESAVQSSLDRINDIRDSMEQTSLKSSGKNHDAYLAGIRANVAKEKEAVDLGVKEQNRNHPENRKEIGKLADYTKLILDQKAAVDSAAPLSEAMAGIAKHSAEVQASLTSLTPEIELQLQPVRDLQGSFTQLATARQQLQQAALAPLLSDISREAADVKAAFAGINPEIELSLSHVKALKASVEQLAQARADKQLIQDAQDSKGVKESTMTPLEKFKRNYEQHQRQLKDGVIDQTTFDRATGDEANEARQQLGYKGPARAEQPAAIERRFDFSAPQSPISTDKDPLDGIGKDVKTTAQEAPMQRIILQKLLDGTKQINLVGV